MAERARNLRKALSKNKATKEKELNNSISSTIPPPESHINVNNIEIDPLKFLEVSNNFSELKQKEQLQNQQMLLDELIKKTPLKEVSLPEGKSYGEGAKFMDLIERMKKNKEDEPIKLFNNNNNQQKTIPGKLGPKELNDEQKNKLLARMSSARQNITKNMLGKEVIKRTSLAILEKAKTLEGKIGDNTPTRQSLPTFFAKDSDVQQTTESVFKGNKNVFNVISQKIKLEYESFLSIKNIQKEKNEINEIMSNNNLRNTMKPLNKNYKI